MIPVYYSRVTNSLPKIACQFNSDLEKGQYPGMADANSKGGMVNHQIENIVKGIFPSDRDKRDPRICQEVAYFSIALIKHNRVFNLVPKLNFQKKHK